MNEFDSWLSSAFPNQTQADETPDFDSWLTSIPAAKPVQRKAKRPPDTSIGALLRGKGGPGLPSGPGPNPNPDEYTPSDVADWNIDSIPKAMLYARTSPEASISRVQQYIGERTPFASGVFKAKQLLRLKSAADAYRDGSATPEDLVAIGDYLVSAEDAKNQTWKERVLDIASAIPGFGVEFTMTGGAYTAAKTAGVKGLTKALGSVAEKSVGKAMLATVPRIAGVGAQTLANPQLIASSVAEQMVPEFQLTGDQAGAIRDIVVKDDPDFMEALAKGFGSAAIEIGSERAGGILGKVPGASRIAALKSAMIKRWLGSGKTLDAFQTVLKNAGWNGVFGEMFEERVGEVARGVTGISGDYGTTGKLFTDPKQALWELSTEAGAFVLPMLPGTLAGANDAALLARQQAQYWGPISEQWKDPNVQSMTVARQRAEVQRQLQQTPLSQINDPAFVAPWIALNDDKLDSMPETPSRKVWEKDWKLPRGSSEDVRKQFVRVVQEELDFRKAANEPRTRESEIDAGTVVGSGEAGAVRPVDGSEVEAAAPGGNAPVGTQPPLPGGTGETGLPTPPPPAPVTPAAQPPAGQPTGSEGDQERPGLIARLRAASAIATQLPAVSDSDLAKLPTPRLRERVKFYEVAAKQATKAPPPAAAAPPPAEPVPQAPPAAPAVVGEPPAPTPSAPAGPTAAAPAAPAVAPPAAANDSIKISPAKYAKKMVAVRVESIQGFKSRAARLAEGVGGRWSGRENAYIMSPAKADRVVKLLATDADYSPITKTFSGSVPEAKPKKPKGAVVGEPPAKPEPTVDEALAKLESMSDADVGRAMFGAPKAPTAAPAAPQAPTGPAATPAAPAAPTAPTAEQARNAAQEAADAEYEAAKAKVWAALKAAGQAPLSNAPLTPELVEALGGLAKAYVKRTFVSAKNAVAQFGDYIQEVAKVFGADMARAYGTQLRDGWDNLRSVLGKDRLSESVDAGQFLPEPQAADRGEPAYDAFGREIYAGDFVRYQDGQGMFEDSPYYGRIDKIEGPSISLTVWNPSLGTIDDVGRKVSTIDGSIMKLVDSVPKTGSATTPAKPAATSAEPTAANVPLPIGAPASLSKLLKFGSKWFTQKEAGMSDAALQKLRDKGWLEFTTSGGAAYKLTNKVQSSPGALSPRAEVADEEYTPSPEEIARANRSYRDTGAVGANAITPKHVADVVGKDETILDFGAGKKAIHAQQLRDAGFKNVTAHEFGENVTEQHDPQALQTKHDVVYASNVLNVQGSRRMLRWTLNQIKQTARPGGRVFMNYPYSPRYADLTEREVAQEIQQVFGVTAKIVGGQTRTPLWEVQVPAAAETQPAADFPFTFDDEVFTGINQFRGSITMTTREFLEESLNNPKLPQVAKDAIRKELADRIEQEQPETEGAVTFHIEYKPSPGWDWQPHYVGGATTPEVYGSIEDAYKRLVDLKRQKQYGVDGVDQFEYMKRYTFRLVDGNGDPISPDKLKRMVKKARAEKPKAAEPTKQPIDAFPVRTKLPPAKVVSPRGQTAIPGMEEAAAAREADDIFADKAIGDLTEGLLTPEAAESLRGTLRQVPALIDKYGKAAGGKLIENSDYDTVENMDVDAFVEEAEIDINVADDLDRLAPKFTAADLLEVANFQVSPSRQSTLVEKAAEDFREVMLETIVKESRVRLAPVLDNAKAELKRQKDAVDAANDEYDRQQELKYREAEMAAAAAEAAKEAPPAAAPPAATPPAPAAEITPESTYKEKRTSRRINNSQKTVVIRTFTGEPTEERYDTFLDTRSNVEDAVWRNRGDSPRVTIDGRLQWASYEFVLEYQPDVEATAPPAAADPEAAAEIEAEQEPAPEPVEAPPPVPEPAPEPVDTNPWVGAPVEDESRWFGTRVDVAGDGRRAGAYQGTVYRVLNAGTLVEVRPDDADTSFRVPSSRVTIRRVEDARAIPSKPAGPWTRPDFTRMGPRDVQQEYDLALPLRDKEKELRKKREAAEKEKSGLRANAKNKRREVQNRIDVLRKQENENAMSARRHETEAELGSAENRAEEAKTPEAFHAWMAERARLLERKAYDIHDSYGAQRALAQREKHEADLRAIVIDAVRQYVDELNGDEYAAAIEHVVRDFRPWNDRTLDQTVAEWVKKIKDNRRGLVEKINARRSVYGQAKDTDPYLNWPDVAAEPRAAAIADLEPILQGRNWYTEQQAIQQRLDELQAAESATAAEKRQIQAEENRRQANAHAMQQAIEKRNKAVERGVEPRFWRQLKAKAKDAVYKDNESKFVVDLSKNDEENRVEVDGFIMPGGVLGLAEIVKRDEGGVKTGEKETVIVHLPTGVVFERAKNLNDARQLIALMELAGIDWRSLPQTLEGFKNQSPETNDRLKKVSRHVAAWDNEDLGRLPQEEQAALLATVKKTATSVQADLILDSDSLGATSNPLLGMSTSGLAMIKSLAEEVPEFAYDPVFRVEEGGGREYVAHVVGGPQNKTVPKGLKLVYRDGFKYSFNPEIFNLVDGELRPGMLIGVNLEDLGIARKTEQDVVAEMLETAGGFDKPKKRTDGTINATREMSKVKLTPDPADKTKWTVEGRGPAADAARKTLERIRWAQPGENQPGAGMKGPVVGRQVDKPPYMVPPPPSGEANLNPQKPMFPVRNGKVWDEARKKGYGFNPAANEWVMDHGAGKTPITPELVAKETELPIEEVVSAMRDSVNLFNGVIGDQTPVVRVPTPAPVQPPTPEAVRIVDKLEEWAKTERLTYPEGFSQKWAEQDDAGQRAIVQELVDRALLPLGWERRKSWSPSEMLDRIGKKHAIDKFKKPVKTAAEKAEAARVKAEAARDKIRKKMNDPKAGLDPEMGAFFLEWASAKVEQGFWEFADFVNEAIQDFGDEMRETWMLYLQDAIRTAKAAVQAEAPPAYEPVVTRTQDDPADAPPPPAPPISPDSERVTALYRAYMDALRAERGEGPTTPAERQSFQQWVDEANQRRMADPDWLPGLVREQEFQPRALSAVENAGLNLLYSLKYAEYEKRMQTVIEARKSGSDADVALAMREAQAAESEVYRVEQAATVSGSEMGRALASKKIQLRRDWSLEGMLLVARSDNGGNPLSDADRAKIEKQAAIIAELERDLAKANEKAERATAEKMVQAEIDKAKAKVGKRKQPATVPPATPPTPPAPSAPSPAPAAAKKPSRVSAAKAKVQAAWDDLLRVFDAGSRAPSGIDPALLPAATRLIRAYLELGVATFAEFVARAKRDLGARVSEMEATLQDVWDEMRDSGEIPTMDLDMEDLPEISDAAREIMRALIEAGIEDRATLIDLVHGELVKSLPELTRLDTMWAISRYKQFAPESRSEAARIMADLTGQIRDLVRLDEMEQGRAPAAAVARREPPSPDRRQLQQKVQARKREGGFAEYDSDRLMKSALASAKTNLLNRIKDLNTEITERARIAKKRVFLEPDAELEQLRAIRDELLVRWRAIFPKEPMSDAQRLKAIEAGLDRAIEQLAGELDRGEIGLPKARRVLTSDAVQAKRRRLDALRASRESLRLADPAVQAEVARRKNAATLARLYDRLANWQQRLADEDYAPKERPVAKPTPEQLDVLHRLQIVRDEFEAQRERWRFSQMSLPRKGLALALEASALQRMFLTSIDFSMTLMQNGILAFSHPTIVGKAFVDSFMAAVPDAAQMIFPSLVTGKKREFQVASEIQNSPRALLFSQAKVAVTSTVGQLSKREEGFVSHILNYLEDIKRSDSKPVWAAKLALSPVTLPLAASNRAAVTMMNKSRALMFESLVGSYERIKGEPITIPEARVIGNAINVATGRGPLGGAEAAAGVLAQIFFSPRFLMSSVQYAVGQPLWNGPARLRLMIAKELYLKTGLGLASFYGLFALAGMFMDPDDDDYPKLDFNWFSDMFGRVKIGKTTIDPTRGIGSLVRTVAQIAGGKYKNRWGEYVATRGPNVGRGQRSAESTAFGYVKGKLAPSLSTILELAFARDYKGDYIHPTQTLAEAFQPISFGNVVDAFAEEGLPKGLAFSIASILGLGIRTYRREQMTPQQVQDAIATIRGRGAPDAESKTAKTPLVDRELAFERKRLQAEEALKDQGIKVPRRSSELSRGGYNPFAR